ncbi:hypothetical protein P8C59_000998 [Phyllachora maydis]|uniref:Uncharacterized protein n=1 Tax=Phyllachora maydis TaxID=1825666 RepID=A0AAD9HYU4_9PEZI|nr:hypothetical protein P8C59_000998 [Phyllachora maydis]
MATTVAVTTSRRRYNDTGKAPLERLPAELQAKICGQMQDDGHGKTRALQLRDLALASRTLSATATQELYRAVTIESLQQLIRLFETLAITNPYRAELVRELCFHTGVAEVNSPVGGPEPVLKFLGRLGELESRYGKAFLSWQCGVPTSMAGVSMLPSAGAVVQQANARLQLVTCGILMRVHKCRRLTLSWRHVAKARKNVDSFCNDGTLAHLFSSLVAASARVEKMLPCLEELSIANDRQEDNMDCIILGMFSWLPNLQHLRFRSLTPWLDRSAVASGQSRSQHMHITRLTLDGLCIFSKEQMSRLGDLLHSACTLDSLRIVYHERRVLFSWPGGAEARASSWNTALARVTPGLTRLSIVQARRPPTHSPSVQYYQKRQMTCFARMTGLKHLTVDSWNLLGDPRFDDMGRRRKVTRKERQVRQCQFWLRSRLLEGLDLSELPPSLETLTVTSFGDRTIATFTIPLA